MIQIDEVAAHLPPLAFKVYVRLLALGMELKTNTTVEVSDRWLMRYLGISSEGLRFAKRQISRFWCWGRTQRRHRDPKYRLPLPPG